MSWMFRWLERLVSHLRSPEGADPKWVEPSNAITRAILAGAAAHLSAKPIHASATVSEPVLAPAAAVAVAAPEVAESEDTLERAAAAAPVTRTAQRSRRRRAGRAA